MISISAHGQAPVPSISALNIPESKDPVNTGVSTDRPEVKKDGTVAPFVYEPVDPDFWKDVLEAMSEGNFEKVVSLGGNQMANRGSSSDEGLEGTLAAAMGLQKMRLSLAATQLYKEVVLKRTGSLMAQQALIGLDEIARIFFYDREDLGDDFLNNNEFGVVHPDTESFISFHTGLYDLTRGYRKWADAAFDKIREGTHWDYENKYLVALGEVARNRADSALEKFKFLAETEGVPSRVKTLAQWQHSRLLFEKGEFETVYKVLTGLTDLPARERGRLIMERAWTKYYLKDFSKALGLLEALKAPLFLKTYPNLEAYILKMVIYKELCHYESVVTVAEDFRTTFESAFGDIKKRKPLRKNPMLARMALLDLKLQWDANFIHQLREEKFEFQDYSFDDLPFYKNVLSEYKSKELQLQARIDSKLENEARNVAEQLIETEEQVAFLDYTSKLDSLRIVRKGENRDYKSEDVSKFSFEKIYWPVEHEYWTDELESYKVLISSRCGEKFGKPAFDEKSK